MGERKKIAGEIACRESRACGCCLKSSKIIDTSIDTSHHISLHEPFYVLYRGEVADVIRLLSFNSLTRLFLIVLIEIINTCSIDAISNFAKKVNC